MTDTFIDECVVDGKPLLESYGADERGVFTFFQCPNCDRTYSSAFNGIRWSAIDQGDYDQTASIQRGLDDSSAGRVKAFDDVEALITDLETPFTCVCGHSLDLHGAAQVGHTMCLDPDHPECGCMEARAA